MYIYVIYDIPYTILYTIYILYTILYIWLLLCANNSPVES